MGGVSLFATDTKVCSPSEGSAKVELLGLVRGPPLRGRGEKGGEIETGDKMSTAGLDKLARRGSLITGGASSSELIFSIPPEGAWLLGGQGA